MTDENKNEEKKVEKTPQADAPEATHETDTPEPEAAPVDVSQEEVTGRETTEEPEEDIAPDQVEELPHRELKPGMVVRVHERIIDVSPKGEQRERIQIFQGLIIGMKGSDISRTMTVRKDSKGWMVEKIFPLSSPNVTKVEVVKQYKTRRAKLNYLRKSTKRGKKNQRFNRKLKEIKE